MGRKGPRNDEATIKERQHKVARMYVEGYTQVEIAHTIGISQPMVSLDLKAIRDYWKANAYLDFDERKLKELAGLDHQEEQLWKAWERSLEVEVVESFNLKRELRTKKSGKKGQETTIEEMVPTEEVANKKRRQLIGDPRYMAEITKVRELRCKILGFLKEDKTTNIGQQNNVVINWDEIAAPRVDEIEQRLQLEQSKVIYVTADSSPRTVASE